MQRDRMKPVHVAQFAIPFITAPISLLSSAYIAYLIYRNQKDGKMMRSKPREHILLGMSLLDISFSFALAFSTTPGPAVMEERLPTYGTVGTCTAQGFFVQLGLGAPLYNACLCVYYLLSVRYHVSDETLMKFAVPAMHFVILSFSLGTAVAAIFMELFNYAGVMGCWIHHARVLCRYDPQYCDRGQRADDFIIYFGLLHVGFCFVFVVISMAVLWCTVRQTETRGRRWEPRLGAGGQSNRSGRSSGATATTTTVGALPLTRRTMETGLLFSTSFLAVWLPTILLGFVGTTNINQLLSVTLNPLQGFFNMLIYTSPDWIPWLKLKCGTTFRFCCLCCCTKNPNGNNNNTLTGGSTNATFFRYSSTSEGEYNKSTLAASSRFFKTPEDDCQHCHDQSGSVDNKDLILEDMEKQQQQQQHYLGLKNKDVAKNGEPSSILKIPDDDSSFTRGPPCLMLQDDNRFEETDDDQGGEFKL